MHWIALYLLKLPWTRLLLICFYLLSCWYSFLCLVHLLNLPSNVTVLYDPVLTSLVCQVSADDSI